MISNDRYTYYECVYIYNNVYIYIIMYVYICIYIHTYIDTYIHACMHACIHTYKHTYIHMYVYTYIRVYIYIYTYICIYICICIYTHLTNHGVSLAWLNHSDGAVEQLAKIIRWVLIDIKQPKFLELVQLSQMIRILGPTKNCYFQCSKSRMFLSICKQSRKAFVLVNGQV